MLEFLRRERAIDPFGGDDFSDEEPRFAGKGPKVALIASIVMALILAGGIATIIITGKNAPPPVAGSLSDIEVVDEAAPAAATPAPTAMPAPTPDATAATDRSADRRPWLTPPSAAEAKNATPPAPVAKQAAANPTPAPAKPIMTTAAPPAPAQNAAPNASKDASKDTKDTSVADAEPFGPAPGAPDHFLQPPDAAPATASNRPRMVEPALPPTDKTAIDAPPPRFANLVDFKKDKAQVPPGAAKIAVVVEDLGLSQIATDAAITKLPPAVTLAFSPYTHELKKWIDKAKAVGHEVLIEVPMESKAFPAADPGPLGLLTSAEQKDNQKNLDAIIKESGGVIGIFDADGSKFRESETNIAPVFAALKTHNLFYVQGTPGVRVGDAGVPVAVADVVLDERPFRADVDSRLDYAERLAKYQGSAVASMSAKPIGFERLVLWLDQAQKKGVTLAPISQVLIR